MRRRQGVLDNAGSPIFVDLNCESKLILRMLVAWLCVFCSNQFLRLLSDLIGLIAFGQYKSRHRCQMTADFIYLNKSIWLG
jgi:hypothetical protein